jgi:hypothetical protein
MRAFTIKAKSLKSAQSLFDALRRFDPALGGSSSEGYSVSVDVGASDRRILEVLDAIHEHVNARTPAASSWTDGRTPSTRTELSAHPEESLHRDGRPVIEGLNLNAVH